MKNLYFIAVIFCFGNVAQGQIINFQDPNFKNVLVNTNNTTGSVSFDTNNDGEIEVSEAQAVTRIFFSGVAVSSVAGIEHFSNLLELQFSSTVPVTVDVHQLSNLRLFSTFGSDIASFNAVGLQNLKSIYMRNANLPTVDFTGMSTLESFSCDTCGLTSLNLNGLNNLTSLQLINNPITSLDLNGLPSLTHLWAYNMSLTSLDLSVVPTIQSVVCNNNQLSSINLTGTNQLGQLNCDNNQLSAIDLSDNPNLAMLQCGKNQLTTLDINSNTNLFFIDCQENQLTDLDLSHSSFQHVVCSSNNLTAINLKNSFYDGEVHTNQGQTYGRLLFDNNPNLTYICADPIETEYVQGKLALYGNTNCVVNTYCSFSPGGEFYTISGSNKIDSDNNGCDQNDDFLPHLKYVITNGIVSGTIIPNASGNYSISVQEGTHTFTPIFENPDYFLVSPTSATVTFPAETSTFTQNFCITPNGIHNDLEVNIIPLGPARPGFDAIYKIIYKNKGNQVQSGTVSFAYNAAVLDFANASVTPSSQPMNYINWDFTSLKPFETRDIFVTFNVNSPLETPPVNGGFVLDYTLSVYSSVVEETPDDNIFVLHQTVVNSFDPNNKVCLEGSSILPEMVGKYVHYVINFENTGTANAENIVVMDMIDTTKFDISSFVPITGSHLFTTKISGNNKVEFIFENINLPFDDANNDGYLAFKIKTNSDLNIGDSFSNSASIYFDFNAPIVTDPAVTAIGTLLANNNFEFDSAFSILPNPANSMIQISNLSNEEYEIQITSMLGKVLIQEKYSDTIDVSNLSQGIYLVTVHQGERTSTQKLIKN